MQGRRARRAESMNSPGTLRKININKKQVIVMLIMAAICVFIVAQTAYLFKYTMGKQIDPNRLKVYNWIKALVNNEQIK